VESVKKVAVQEITYKDEKLTMRSKEDRFKALTEARRATKSKEDKGKESKKRSRDSSGGDGKEGDNKRGTRLTCDKNNQEGDAGKAKDVQSNYKAYPKGVFVNVKGVGEGCRMQTIKDIFAQYGNVKYVAFKEGQTDACVRFEASAESAQAVND
jgi:hypothetical protein